MPLKLPIYHASEQCSKDSCLFRPLARKSCWGVLLKEMWTFSYGVIQPTTDSQGAVDELIFYDVCKPTLMRANCKHTRYINFKKCIVFTCAS